MMQRRIGRALLGSGGIVIATALLVTGCDSGDKDKAVATSPPTSSTSAAPSSPPPATGAGGPLTPAELTWSKSVESLIPTMNKVYTDSSTTITPSALLAMAKKARACGRELERIGAPTARLQPIHALVKKACDEYEKGAKCFEEAGRIGIPVSGSAEDKKHEAKLKCGFASSGPGGQALADAYGKLDGIKAQATVG